MIFSKRKLALRITENDVRLKYYRYRWILLAKDKSSQADKLRDLLRQAILLREKRRRRLLTEYNFNI